ncbi:MAG: glycosyltransferase family 2 protein [Candidatus Aminicenantes bacterium]|nr:glycosyltransferase family 2 protein [Candidatus Aminicenantes bacterium]
MRNLLIFLIPSSSILILIYFLILNTFYIFFLVVAIGELLRYRRLLIILKTIEVLPVSLVKPVSIIAPAFNEQNSIVQSVSNLLSLDYPVYEVIVVNDGSSDETLSRLIEHFKLKQSSLVFRKSLETKPIRAIYTNPEYPRLIVIDKENGKKADALNAGLNISRYPLFCAVDSDSVLDRDALQKVVRPFLEDPEKTIAAGGIIRLSNGCVIEKGQLKRLSIPRNILVRFQIIEYLRAFLGGRVGLSRLNSLLIVSGAFGLFRKDIVMAIGGYRKNTVGEDMDLVVRMRQYLHENKKPFAVRFLPDPICWTEAPSNLRSLGSQRNRWHRGLIETLAASRKMLFNPRYGVTGLLALPFYFIFEMVGPLVELYGYLFFILASIFRVINYTYAALFFALAVVVGAMISLGSILLEEFSQRRYPRAKDILALLPYCFLENIIYRQYLSYVRVKAFIDYFKGKKEWGKIEKKGF